MIDSAVYIIHIIICIAIIALVLLQQGKGANAGASFGGGASGTVFGAAGKANFLEKLTRVLVGIFFITSLVMMFNFGKVKSDESVVERVTQELPVVEEGASSSTTLPAIEE